MSLVGKLQTARRGLHCHLIATAFAALAVAAVGAPVVSPVLALLAGGVVYRASGELDVDLVPDRSVLVRALLVGGLGVLAIQIVAHSLEVATLSLTGADPSLVIQGESPSTKSTATGQVWGYLLFGVLLTAVGEEVLFRGALLGTLTDRLGLHRANAVQAALFGAWHLAWPLAVALGPFEPPVPMAIYAIGFVLVSGVVGGALGVLVGATGSLWTGVLAHAVHNGVALYVHVRAPGVGRASVLSAALVAGYAILAGLVWWWTDRFTTGPVPGP